MSTRSSPDEIEIISATAAGRIGGAALLFGALSNLITVVLLAPGSAGRTIGLWLSLTTVGVAIVALFAPWERWGRHSTLVLVPVAFVLLGIGNYTDPLPYVAGIYFVVIGAWTGLCHRRFTTLALAPVFATMYWAPLAVRPNLGRLESSALIVTVVSVAIGEVLCGLRITLERSQRELAASAGRRFTALTRNSLDVTLVLGSDDRIRYVSPAMEARFGHAPSDIEQIPLSDFLARFVSGISDESKLSLVDGSFRHEDSSITHEMQLRRADGTWVDIEVTAQNLIDDPDIAGIVVHVRDITSRKALELDLQRRAYQDDLTGLANRASFRNEIKRASESSEHLAVIYLDLDGFKEVNDTSGHEVGDRLLQLVAKRLLDTVPSNAVVARLGGDEFAVMMRGESDDVSVVADALIRSLSEPYKVDDTVLNVGVSAGVAQAGPTDAGDRVISDADMAMYAAKVNDFSSVVEFHPQMREQLLAKVEMTSRLKRAVSNGDFVLHYQPSMETKGRSWVGAEALIRWDDGGDRLIQPGEFINVAEDSGLIVELGRWIVAEACREAVGWSESPDGQLWVAVNVSACQFQDPRLLDDVDTALRSSGLPPERLVIEVTESILIGETESAHQRLRGLHEMGIRLALDDFGTGYSSLSYLQAFPFDILKIDRSFVRNATTSTRDLSLLQTINRLGHNLGLQTLVEGIETAAQAELVTSMGCDLAQGFHLARPVDSTGLRAMSFSGASAAHQIRDGLAALSGAGQLRDNGRHVIE
ncbi:MAG: EAL domain-containing protein [Microthrixaceae bacterium]|nr:EAL domain-containing protein [Microthrixaceae bacterium]